MKIDDFFETIDVIVEAISTAEKNLRGGADKKAWVSEAIGAQVDVVRHLTEIAGDAYDKVEDIIGDTIDRVVASMNNSGAMPAVEADDESHGGTD